MRPLLFGIVAMLIASRTLAAGGDAWDFFAEGTQPPAGEDDRVVVYYFTADFYCQPCERFKGWSKDEKGFKFVESVPNWEIPGFPTLQWKGEDGKWYWVSSGFKKNFKEKFLETNPDTYRKLYPEEFEGQEKNGYPLRGANQSRWMIDNMSYPPRAYLINHLLTAPDHAGQFTRARLDKMEYEELMSLHGDDHEGTVKPFIARPARSNVSSAPATYYYSNPVRKRRRGRFFSGGCPGGVCP